MDCYKELFLFLVLAGVAYFIGKKRGFFQLPKASSERRVSLFQVITAFLLFFGTSLLVTTLSPPTAYFGIAAFSLSFAALISYALLPSQKKIWGHLAKKFYFYGLFTWFLAFPLAAFAGKIAACIMQSLYGYTEAKQYVAEQLLRFKPYPLLFTLIAILTLLFIPLVEELLFRGFLQNFLLSKLPRVAALPLTALLFTLAHFNLHQGLGNVQILSTLFVLSLFLSYIYEKWGSLLAPIALHQIFNTLSFIGLLYL